MPIKGLGFRLLCDASQMCGTGKAYVGDDTNDKDALKLSHVGMAAYQELRTKHSVYHHKLWNVTSGIKVGQVHQTPLKAFSDRTVPGTLDDIQTEVSAETPEADKEEMNFCEGHDDWFPERMCEIMKLTEVWCDVLSLGPPDGSFMEKFHEALVHLAEKAASKEKPIIIRMMFGNIPAMPVNCHKVIKKLTKGIPKDSNIRLWVGSWRKGVSWNHAKIIAVDGKHLHTGGHNLWDQHYLKHSPVHDLSFELEGNATFDGHFFADEQWAFIEDSQSTVVGKVIDKLPDYLPMVLEIRVTISEFPRHVAGEFPPMFDPKLLPVYEPIPEAVTMITMGRYGTLLHTDRPSDDAFIAMIDSSQTIIRMALQDLGPVCIPGTKLPLPGCVWPKPYLKALARAIWERGVDVEIILSNPGSIPGGLNGTEACYGNGWSCVDVAAEIIKRIKKLFPEACPDELRQKVVENLRICFIKQPIGDTYSDGTSIGMHAKHFIIDDICCYTGSQNLYVCDLAEWGVVIDNKEETEKIMAEYWNPLWKYSYTGDDVDVQEVMDGLDINRDGDEEAFAKYTEEEKAEFNRKSQHMGGEMPTDISLYGDDDDDDSDDNE